MRGLRSRKALDSPSSKAKRKRQIYDTGNGSTDIVEPRKIKANYRLRP
jgi:hypothetical protein